jgi:hypothetical protein
MDRGAALNCHVVHNWKAKNAAVAQIDNDDADLLMSTTLGKTKNGAVPKPPIKGA